MHGQTKIDLEKVLKLRAQGLSSSIIARRLGVTNGAIYHVFRRHEAKNQTRKDTKNLAKDQVGGT